MRIDQLLDAVVRAHERSFFVIDHRSVIDVVSRLRAELDDDDEIVSEVIRQIVRHVARHDLRLAKNVAHVIDVVERKQGMLDGVAVAPFGEVSTFDLIDGHMIDDFPTADERDLDHAYRSVDHEALTSRVLTVRTLYSMLEDRWAVMSVTREQAEVVCGLLERAVRDGLVDVKTTVSPSVVRKIASLSSEDEPQAANLLSNVTRRLFEPMRWTQSLEQPSLSGHDATEHSLEDFPDTDTPREDGIDSTHKNAVDTDLLGSTPFGPQDAFAVLTFLSRIGAIGAVDESRTLAIMNALDVPDKVITDKRVQADLAMISEWFPGRLDRSHDHSPHHYVRPIYVKYTQGDIESAVINLTRLVITDPDRVQEVGVEAGIRATEHKLRRALLEYAVTNKKLSLHKVGISHIKRRDSWDELPESTRTILTAMVRVCQKIDNERQASRTGPDRRSVHRGPVSFEGPIEELGVLSSSLSLYEHQVPILREALHECLHDPGGRALIHASTGTGKTRLVTAILHAQSLKQPVKALVLSDTSALNTQNATAISRPLGLDARRRMGSRTILTATSQHLDIDFMTIQRARGIGRDRLRRAGYTHVVVDECHITPADTYGPVIDSLGRVRRIGLSAVPFREDSRSVTHYFGKPLRSSIPLSRAMSKEIVAPMTIIDMSDVLKRDEVVYDLNNRRHSIVDVNRNMFIPQRDTNIVEAVLERAESIGKVRAIWFARSVEHCMRLSRLVPGSRVVATGLPSNARTIDEFRNGVFDHVITVDMFSKGIDIPDVNLLVMCRRVQSKPLLLNQLGRGLRWQPHKRLWVMDFANNMKVIADALDHVDESNNRLLSLKQSRKQQRQPSGEVTVPVDSDAPGVTFDFSERMLDGFDLVDTSLRSWTRTSALQAAVDEVRLIQGNPELQLVTTRDGDLVHALDREGLTRAAWRRAREARRIPDTHETERLFATEAGNGQVTFQLALTEWLSPRMPGVDTRQMVDECSVLLVARAGRHNRLRLSATSSRLTSKDLVWGREHEYLSWTPKEILKAFTTRGMSGLDNLNRQVLAHLGVENSSWTRESVLVASARICRAWQNDTVMRKLLDKDGLITHRAVERAYGLRLLPGTRTIGKLFRDGGEESSGWQRFITRLREELNLGLSLHSRTKPTLEQLLQQGIAEIEHINDNGLHTVEYNGHESQALRHGVLTTTGIDRAAREGRMSSRREISRRFDGVDRYQFRLARLKSPDGPVGWLAKTKRDAISAGIASLRYFENLAPEKRCISKMVRGRQVEVRLIEDECLTAQGVREAAILGIGTGETALIRLFGSIKEFRKQLREAVVDRTHDHHETSQGLEIHTTR